MGMSDYPPNPESAQPPVPQSPASPPPYAANPYPANGYAAAPRTNVLAIISLIAAFVFPLAGVITGHIALSQIRQTGEQGHGLAKAGLILSYVFIGLGILAAIAYVIFFVVLIGASSYNGTSY